MGVCKMDKYPKPSILLKQLKNKPGYIKYYTLWLLRIKGMYSKYTWLAQSITAYMVDKKLLNGKVIAGHIPACASYYACVWRNQTRSHRWYCNPCTNASLYHNSHKYWPLRNIWMTVKMILQTWDFYSWACHWMFLNPVLNKRKYFKAIEWQCVPHNKHLSRDLTKYM